MNLYIKDKERLIYIMIFCLVVVVSHVAWRTIIDTGLENRDYNQRLSKGQDVGILAKIKDTTWKWTIGETPDRSRDRGREIYLFGHDLAKPFEPICKVTTKVVYHVCHIFDKDYRYVEVTNKKGETNYYIRNTRYPDQGFEIIWGCTGVKQVIIFFFIMLTTLGKMKDKMLYFLAGAIAILIFNIIRISLIINLSIDDMSQFDFWHNSFFKIVFYIVMFILWYIWAEIISRKLYEKK